MMEIMCTKFHDKKVCRLGENYEKWVILPPMQNKVNTADVKSG